MTLPVRSMNFVGFSIRALVCQRCTSTASNWLKPVRSAFGAPGGWINSTAFLVSREQTLQQRELPCFRIVRVRRGAARPRQSNAFHGGFGRQSGLQRLHPGGVERIGRGLNEGRRLRQAEPPRLGGHGRGFHRRRRPGELLWNDAVSLLRRTRVSLGVLRDLALAARIHDSDDHDQKKHHEREDDHHRRLVDAPGAGAGALDAPGEFSGDRSGTGSCWDRYLPSRALSLVRVVEVVVVVRVVLVTAGTVFLVSFTSSRPITMTARWRTESTM